MELFKIDNSSYLIEFIEIFYIFISFLNNNIRESQETDQEKNSK